MSEPIRAVAYYRMSSNPQEKSIPQQRAELLPRCQLAGVAIVKDFQDEGISGGGMKRRNAYLDMLAFCQAQAKAGKAVDAIACYDTSRFSRATSMETAHYIWEFQQAGVNRVFTWERWHDFRKEEDRAIFLLQQDFANNRYLRDLSARVLRGRKDLAQAGYFSGGAVPYGFDRVVLSANGDEVTRIPRGVKLTYRQKGCHEVLAPIPADDPDPDRQLERQTAVWMYTTFDQTTVSFRQLAHELNVKGIPAPGCHYQRKRHQVGPPRWNGMIVRRILTRPVYRGISRFGERGRGKHHRLVQGEIQPVEPGAPSAHHGDGFIETPMDHGALIPPDLWERVQRKVGERTRRRSYARTGGYILPPGILHCGHCGGKMHGSTAKPRRNGKVYEYRNYICSTATYHKGACKHYAVREDELIRFLLKKLQEVYLAPDRLEALRQRLRKREEAKHRASPAQAEGLRKRLETLDAEIARGRRNLFRAKDDETFEVLNEELRKHLDQRARLQRELEAAERAGEVPVDEVTAKVEKAVERLKTLCEDLKGASRERLGEVIRKLVSRIDLHFEPEHKKRRLFYRFSKGAIKLRPLLDVSGGGSSDK